MATDDKGFEIFVRDANIAFVRAPYVKKLAKRGGPCPRRQDLDQNGLIIGRVPKGRALSVSHAWDTQYHISPSGSKMKRLAETLEKLGANDEEDGVFLDCARMASPHCACVIALVLSS